MLVFCILFSLLCACGAVPPSPSPSATQTVTDMLGREVTLPKTINSVACIGSGALRLYSYVGDMQLLCGVESCEYGFLVSARPYQMVHEDYFKTLASIGAGGPKGSADAEALLSANPDVIFSLYTSDAKAMDMLQAKTGIPVVVLHYGETEVFNPTLSASITLMGKVLGREARAKEVTDYLAFLEADLKARTEAIPTADKPTVYLGCQSYYGTHGITSSTANYALFDAIGARNVLDIHGYRGYQSAVDLESLLEMNPDVIILDAGGLEHLRKDFQTHGEVLQKLSAFQSGQVYLQLPYNAYFTNIEMAIVNTYFIGKVLYPPYFLDIDIPTLFDEVSVKLLGMPSYEMVISQIPEGYTQLDINTWLN